MKKILSTILIFAMALNLFSVSTFAQTDDTRQELIYAIEDKCWRIKGSQEPGEMLPYTFTTANALIKEANSLVKDENATIEELQAMYDRLCDKDSYIYVLDYYAKISYIFALEESNDDNWYEESDWSDFTSKRDNLREAFKTNDEKIISDAYRALYKSFKTMTMRYRVAGDLNKDGVANIADTTMISKHNVGLIKLNSAQIMLAQCYNAVSPYDITLNVTDTTNHQKALAGFEGYLFNNEPENLDGFLHINSMGEDFSYFIFVMPPHLDDYERSSWANDRIKELGI
jgi:hypothetical protein